MQETVPERKWSMRKVGPSILPQDRPNRDKWPARFGLVGPKLDDCKLAVQTDVAGFEFARSYPQVRSQVNLSFESTWHASVGDQSHRRSMERIGQPFLFNHQNEPIRLRWILCGGSLQLEDVAGFWRGLGSPARRHTFSSIPTTPCTLETGAPGLRPEGASAG